MGDEGRARSIRPVTLLSVLLVCLSTAPATAQTNLSGEYEADFVFQDIEPPCLNPNYLEPVSDWPMTVLMRGTSNVDITFPSLPSAGLDLEFNASINANLEVVADSNEGWTITGGFAVNGTAVSFSGRVQWTNECQTDPNNPTQRAPVPQSFTVQASRVSVGEDTQAPLEPLPAAEVSTALALDAFRRACPPAADNSDCDESFIYMMDWLEAMDADVRALNLDARSDSIEELVRLRAIVGWASRLGGLLGRGPTGAVSRFPIIHSLLPRFGQLFVQGVSEAATGQVDALRTTVALADRLLAMAVTADSG